MKIVVLDGYTENPGDLSWAGFEALGSLTVYDRTPFVEGNAEILRRARGAEAVIVNKTPLAAETIGALLPELRYIGVLATGFNVVDIAAAKAAGLTVVAVYDPFSASYEQQLRRSCDGYLKSFTELLG